MLCFYCLKLKNDNSLGLLTFSETRNLKEEKHTKTQKNNASSFMMEEIIIHKKINNIYQQQLLIKIIKVHSLSHAVWLLLL